MKKTLFALAGIGLLSVFLVYPAFSHNPGGHMMNNFHEQGEHMDAEHHHGAWYGNEALTEEQKKELGKLRNEFAADTKEVRSQLQQKAAELQAVMASPTPDQAKAKKLLKEINAIKNKLAEKRLEFKLQANKIAPDVLAGNNFCQGPGQGQRHHRMMSW